MRSDARALRRGCSVDGDLFDGPHRLTSWPVGTAQADPVTSDSIDRSRCSGLIGFRTSLDPSPHGDSTLSAISKHALPGVSSRVDSDWVRRSPPSGLRALLVCGIPPTVPGLGGDQLARLRRATTGTPSERALCQSQFSGSWPADYGPSRSLRAQLWGRTWDLKGTHDAAPTVAGSDSPDHIWGGVEAHFFSC